MRAGDVVIDDKETFKILRSAADGGRCEFEVILAGGGEGPPAHTHDELEDGEVLEGAILFTMDGVETLFRAGDRIVIPAGCVHTFRNASKTEPVRVVGTHSASFERLIDQLAQRDSAFLRLCRYLSEVDPRASYMVNPVVRISMRALAVFARIRGVTIVPATGAYGPQ